MNTSLAQAETFKLKYFRALIDDESHEEIAHIVRNLKYVNDKWNILIKVSIGIKIKLSNKLKILNRKKRKYWINLKAQPLNEKVKKIRNYQIQKIKYKCIDEIIVRKR